MDKNNKNDIFNPQRWGLSVEKVNQIPKVFNNLFNRFKKYFKTKKMDMSILAKHYLKGLLTIDTKRTISEIARKKISCRDDGQRLHYFITDADWGYRQVFEKIQSEIASNEDFRGGMLILDDTGMRKYGNQIIGAKRQYIGREGKTENGIVMVCLGYHKGSHWSLVDAELYIPESWFTNHSRKELTDEYFIPSDRVFSAKNEIGLSLILKAQQNGLPFSIVGCDTWYGRDSSFRYSLNHNKIYYIAKIPSNSKVISELGLSRSPERKEQLIEGNQFSLFPNDLSSSEVKEIIESNDFQTSKIEVRNSERGVLTYECFYKRVRCYVPSMNKTLDEWLFVHKESDGTYKFSLSNLPIDAKLSKLAYYHCECYFVERNFQDCKSELGWTDMEVRKYRSIMHHTCLVFLCLWFICLVKYYLCRNQSVDVILKDDLSVHFLPKLSTSNIIELCKILFPLRAYDLSDAISVVITHLVNRSRSIASKRRKQIREQQYNGI
jgi:SRSO17 transposase